MSHRVTIIDAGKESAEPFKFLLDVTQKHGDAVQYTGPLGRTYLLNHPDYVKQVLLSPQFHRTSLVKVVLGEGMLASDGDGWKQQRRRAVPFFNRTAIADIEPLIHARTLAMIERWDAIAECGDTIDVSQEMTELTLTIIVDALFGIELGSTMTDLCQALDVLLNDLGDMGCTQLNTPLTFTATGGARFRTALETVNVIVSDIITRCREGKAEGADLLRFLLDYRHEDSGQRLTDKELRDEVVTFMIAGHETTALILSWAWKQLADNPDVERALHAELDENLGTTVPNLDDLDRLPFTLMVLRESMRLYPPVWFIARKSLYAGDVAGVEIPDNVLVIVSPYAIHRHPEFWSNPDAFDPSRFSVGSRQAKYSYIPFGGGHHLCLGMNLALVEGQMILAAMAQRYRVRPVSSRPVEPQPAITLRLRDGLKCTLLKRQAKGTPT